MNYLSLTHSSIGLKYTVDIDCAFSLQSHTPLGHVVFALICSGKGKNYGKLAASKIADSFRCWFEAEMSSQLCCENYLENIQQQWTQLLIAANDDLYNKGQQEGVLLGACASALLLFNDGHYLLAHVGDTRIFYVNSSCSKRLTQDHTFIEREILLGHISPQQAKSDPRRNLLLQCIGGSTHIDPQFTQGIAEIGDVFVLCSSTCNREITASDISSVLLAGTSTDKKFFQKALKNLFPATDKNFSIVLVAVQNQDNQEVKRDMSNTAGTIYEGSDPYVFISYSHKDTYEMREVTELLNRNGVRYWYDDGLHSGDDWNYSIAAHLKNSAVCLLLLSSNSASSDYVKNELNFAINHRIPVHTLQLHSFSIPLDIELMTGRVQMVEMIDNYGKELLNALPTEVFRLTTSEFEEKSSKFTHPLYESGNVYLDRQGTKSYFGKHRKLNYPCTIQIDILRAGTEQEAQSLAVWASSIIHPLFPRIYDIVFKNGIVQTYQEYRNEEFLDQYLKNHPLSEQKILEWIILVVDGLDYLFKRNLGLRDLARGNVVVTNGEGIGIFRLQNLYYGLLKLQENTKQYYFENELQEIAILLAQLCTGTTPILPLRMIEQPKYSRRFMDIVNLVIQKCTREYGRTQYSSFDQLKNDLKKSRISFSDRLFLNTRKKKLQQYDAAREQRKVIFTASDALDTPSNVPPITRTLEEEFGFEGTVVLQDQSCAHSSGKNASEMVMIRLAVCSTGQVFEFSKTSIIIGKEPTMCDLVWKQPYISRMHLRINRKSENIYTVSDLYTTNGSFVSYADGSKNIDAARVPCSAEMEVPSGTIITIGKSQFKILPTS